MDVQADRFRIEPQRGLIANQPKPIEEPGDGKTSISSKGVGNRMDSPHVSRYNLKNSTAIMSSKT